MLPAPKVDLGNDTSLCEEDPESSFTLKAPKGFAFYLWQDGSTGETMKVDKHGVYRVTVTSANGCSATDELTVRPCPPILHIPNVFSPNGDSHNDIFKVYGWNVLKYHIDIYNRWGELVFTSDTLTYSWDGTFRSGDCEEDAYIYMLRYEGVGTDRRIRQYRKGFITLIR
ncbi:MAG: gliding motility-associated C-terminal domain-containing protein [Bacteroidota bacterium]|nr:gliding motility-associated C-terminal domain-containing protein [Bacteroidota bacterium]